MILKSDEIVLAGQILSRGIGFGKPIFLNSQNIFEENNILRKDIDEEISKFNRAIKKSQKQILEIKKSLANDKLSITFDILNTHLEILNDPIIILEVVNRIKKESKSINAILKDIILEYKKKIKDPFFKEKVSDISDVFKRILTNIGSIKVDTLKNVISKSIIISDEIVPSDIFETDVKKIAAFVSSATSYESHAAIIARSKNIPFLSKIDIEKIKNVYIQDIIVDAHLGKIIINPSQKTYEKYEKSPIIQEPSHKIKTIRLKNNINIFANISSLKEIDLINKKVSGIGLLRTEFLFFKKHVPSEDQQFKVYKKIAKNLKNRPFVIRLFDLGGDKMFYNILDNSQNNFFGDRGVSLLLKNKKILEDQIKAILKASFFGNIYLLIPFVKNIEEIRQVKKIIKDIQKDLKISTSTIKIGSMIETPIAALMSNEIAYEVDFLSIGTNDLCRYTFATDKFNFKELHPGLIKLFKMIIKTAKDLKKPTFLCGEMVLSNKIFNELIELGISNFSVGIKNVELFQK